VEKYSTARQTTNENMAHEHCVIDIKGYKHTLTVRNIYFFSIATNFALKRLNITLYVNCLSWLVVGNVVIHYVTVGYATTKDATTKESYKEEFFSIKSGCYNEQRCYNERGGIISVDVARACA